MKDKAVKAFRWIWDNKERMVLVVMVGVLCYRIYVVLNPEVMVETVNARPPDRSVEGHSPEIIPPEVPAPPALDLPGNYTGLYRNNPYWYYAGDRGVGEEEVTAATLGINLLDIKEAAGTWRAQLQTETTRKWYEEGEQFEEFELIEINAEEGTAVVYSERYGERVTLSM